MTIMKFLNACSRWKTTSSISNNELNICKFLLIIELAEEVGFEPTVELPPTPIFKTGAFDHSATPPDPLELHI